MDKGYLSVGVQQTQDMIYLYSAPFVKSFQSNLR